MRHGITIALLLAGLLTGCYQETPTSAIMVDTTPPGASCVISQLGTPLAIAEPTPAIAVINTADAEIGVACRRVGFTQAAVTLPPPGPGALVFGVDPDRPPEINYNTRVDITMIPALRGTVQ